jgi:hypothetical protein
MGWAKVLDALNDSSGVWFSSPRHVSDGINAFDRLIKRAVLRPISKGTLCFIVDDLR